MKPERLEHLRSVVAAQTKDLPDLQGGGEWVVQPTTQITLVRDLLAEYDKLERELEEAKADLWATEQRLKDVELERDEARAENTRLRARVHVEVEDVELAMEANDRRPALTLDQCLAWARANGIPDAFVEGVLSGGPHDVATCIAAVARGASMVYVKRPGLDILDEMAATEVE